MEAIVERKPSKVGLLCFLALNIVDSVMTWWLLSLGGTEGNWYHLWSLVPIWAVLILKMSLVGGIAILVYKYRRPLFRLLNVGMGLVVAINAIPAIGYLIGRIG